MRRLVTVGVLSLVVSAALVGVGSPAMATPLSVVWVDATGFLHYDHTDGAPPTKLTIRSSGSTFVVDDHTDINAGAGCTHVAGSTVVHCTGLSTAGNAFAIIDASPFNDVVDFYVTAPFQGTGTAVSLYEGSDTFYGGESVDIVHGGPGDDSLYGYGGKDWFYGEAGADRISGGAGVDDVIYWNSPAGVIADLDGAALDDGMPGEQDSLGGDIENIHGSPFDDTLTGNALENYLSGCGGSDRLYGLDGADTFMGDNELDGCGSRGGDLMVGGNGIDKVAYWDRRANIFVDLGGSPGNDGESGEGDTVGVDIEQIRAGYGNDVLIGSSLSNVIEGDIGNDAIYGLDGDDKLYGGQGNDYINGGNGGDALIGGEGTDRCLPGSTSEVTVDCE